MIACQDVTRHIEAATLLDGISLSVGEGQLAAVVGPNGAGKSTLLHVLAGDVRPDTGTVHLAGRPLASYSLHELAKTRAVLPQHASLSFPFDVLEVVLLGRAPHVLAAESEEDLGVARESLARVGLEGFEERALRLWPSPLRHPHPAR